MILGLQLGTMNPPAATDTNMYALCIGTNMHEEEGITALCNPNSIGGGSKIQHSTLNNNNTSVMKHISLFDTALVNSKYKKNN